MKITLVATGRTNDSWVKEGMSVYLRRLEHYTAITYIETDDVKLKAKKPLLEAIRNGEQERQMRLIAPSDIVVLFDEHGKALSSTEFAGFFSKHHLAGSRHLIFFIGGAHGFASAMHDRANLKLALSAMTFPHQLVRIIALEQLYRAHTIIKGEPYHHV